MSSRRRLVGAVEEGAGEVGGAPFARAGVLVEAPEVHPNGAGSMASPVSADDLAAEGLRGLAFLADGLALARGEVGEEGVEVGVAAVLPVELLGDAVEEAHLRARLGLLFACRR